MGSTDRRGRCCKAHSIGSYHCCDSKGGWSCAPRTEDVRTIDICSIVQRQVAQGLFSWKGTDMSAMQASRNVRQFFCRRTAYHAGNLRRVFGSFSIWGLVLPIGIVVLVASCSHAWWYYARPWQQEVYRPWILGIGFLAATTFWIMRGEEFHRWSMLVIGALYCCEVQLDGIWPAAYFVPILLAWNGSLNYQQLRPYVESRLVVSLFGCGLIGCCSAMILRWEFWGEAPRRLIWWIGIEQAQATLGDVMITGAVIASEILWRLGLLETDEFPITIPIRPLEIDERTSMPDRRAA